MARNRNIAALRQILASDITAIQTNYQLNNQLLLRDIVGVTSGVITGLEIVSYSGLNVYVPTGSISDGNGNFYELLATGTVTLPSSDDTYKIYAATGSTSDTEISSFALLNTATRSETYSTYNARTYDSITLGYTTGSIPSGAEYLADVVVSGGTITGVTDQRTLITLGNLPAYTLQGLYTNDNNTLTITNKISGVIGDDSTANTKFLSFIIDNSHDGYGLYGNVGTNSGAIGSEITSNGNVAYKAITSNANGIGYLAEIGATGTAISIDSNSQVSTIGILIDGLNEGLVLTNANLGFKHTLQASDKAIQIVGANSSDIGIDIDNVNDSLNIAHNALASSSNLITLDFDASTDVYTRIGIKSTVGRSGTNIKLDWTDGEATSTYYGLASDNNSGQDELGSAIIINSDGGSNNSFEYGMKIYNSINGIVIDKSTATDSIGIWVANSSGSTAADSIGFKATISNTSIGLLLLTDGSGNTDKFGIYATQGNDGTFETVLFADNYLTGIDLTNNASAVGINISGNGTSDYGIKIDGANLGIYLNDNTKGINIINPSAGTGIDIDGQSDDIGITINNCEYGLQVTNPNAVGTSYGYYADGTSVSNLSYGFYGVNYHNAFLAASSSKGFVAADTTPITLHCSDSDTTTADATGVVANGDIIYDSSNGLYLRHGGSWHLITIS